MVSRVLTSLALSLCVTTQSNNADNIYKAGDVGTTRPVAVFSPEPDFTNRARKKKIQGTVRMSVIIGKDGKVQDVKLEHSVDPGLDANAIKAVKNWKFTPCQKDDQPVRCRTSVEVSYLLF